jgi:hypothetical protein
MAQIDLKGSLKQIPGATTPALLVTEAADALDGMMKAYTSGSGGTLTIKHAYVDPYKLITEIADKKDYSGLNSTAATTKILDTLKANGQPTIDELNAALTELNEGANDDNGQGKFNYGAFTDPTAMYRGPATQLHPTIAEGTWIFGWPNIPDSDPRRTGKVVVFNVSDAAQADWLMQNSYKHGFAYYIGPCDTFIYVGVTNIKQDGLLASVCGWGSRFALAKQCKRDGAAIDETSLAAAEKKFNTPNAGLWETADSVTAIQRNGSGYKWKWVIDNKVNMT